MKETGSTATEEKGGDCSQTKNEKNGGHFGKEADKVSRVDGAGGVEEEMRTEEALPELRLSLRRLNCS